MKILLLQHSPYSCISSFQSFPVFPPHFCFSGCFSGHSSLQAYPGFSPQLKVADQWNPKFHFLLEAGKMDEQDFDNEILAIWLF